MDLRVSVVGFVVGVLVGLTGIGTGSLTMPLLVLWLGVPPLAAVGSDIAYAAITKVAGAWQHARLGNVDFRRVAHLAVGSVPASVAAAWLVTRHGESARIAAEYVPRLVGAALVLSALVLLSRGLLVMRRGAERQRPWLLGSAGALLGAVVGATSIGSGTFGTALLTVTTRLDPRRIVGTVMMHATIVTFAGGIAHLLAGTIRWDLVALLLLGSVPGVLVGSRLTLRAPEPLLRGALALLLLWLGVRLQFAAFH